MFGTVKLRVELHVGEQEDGESVTSQPAGGDTEIETGCVVPVTSARLTASKI